MAKFLINSADVGTAVIGWATYFKGVFLKYKNILVKNIMLI